MKHVQGKKPVTIKAIAEKVGLSLSAVSKALNNYPDINEETRKMIIGTALNMGYSPNLIAQSLVKKTSNSIGIIVRDISTIYGEMLKPLSQEALKQNLILIMADSNRNQELEEKYIRQMIGSRVKALIIAPVTTDTSKIKQLVNSQMPVIYLGGMVQDEEENFVCADVELEAKITMEYLFSLGHQNIGFVSCARSSSSYRIRHETYVRMMNERSMSPDVNIDSDGSNLIKVGFKQTQILLASKNRVSAVYCASDQIAMGAIKAIYEAGLRIPEDISVIGNDGQENSALPTINLTTVVLPKKEIAENLIRICQSKADNMFASPEHFYAKPYLIERGSCKRV